MEPSAGLWLSQRPGLAIIDSPADCSAALPHDESDVLVARLMGVRDLMEKGFATLEPHRTVDANSPSPSFGVDI